MSVCDFDTALMWVNIVCAAIIIYRGIFHVVNTMTRNTYFPVRAAWILMLTGALAVLVGPLFGFYVKSVQTTFTYAGIATFVFFERRFFKVTYYE